MTGRIGEESAAGWQYHLPDALGSVRQLADAGGAVTLARSYKPFGAVLSSSGSTASSYGFAGEWADGTGLIYLRARYYDPRTGRFITKDPFPGLPTQPQTWHPYVYVADNPVTHTDPSGLFAPWDLVDVVSFGWSLYDFIQCPTWANAGWLALDTVSLLPIIPSIGLIGKFGDLGQLYHVLSNKIMRALSEHRTLRGLFSRSDFVVRAVDEVSHRGYQTWHRLYDDEVVEWLAKHGDATREEFVHFLREIYARPEMQERFPEILDLLR